VNSEPVISRNAASGIKAAGHLGLGLNPGPYGQERLFCILGTNCPGPGLFVCGSMCVCVCVLAGPRKVQLDAYYGQSQRNFIKAKGAKEAKGSGAEQVGQRPHQPVGHL